MGVYIDSEVCQETELDNKLGNATKLYHAVKSPLPFEKGNI